MTQNVSVSVEGPGVRYKQENIGGNVYFFRVYETAPFWSFGLDSK